jgi:hypothetical protein
MNPRTIAASLALLISLLALVLSVPLVARWQLEDRLSKLFNEPASVESVSINPLTGEMQVRQVKVGADIALERLKMTLDLAALFQRKVHVEQLLIFDLSLPLDYQPPVLVVGGLPLPAAPIEPVPAAGSSPELPGWTWQLDTLELNGVAIALQYLNHRHQIRVRHAKVTQLDSEFVGPIGYDLALSIDSAQLLARGEAQPGEVTAITMQVQLSAGLEEFKAYWPVAMSGALVLNQQVVARLDVSGSEIDLSGSAQLTGLALAAEQPVMIDQLDWAGSTRLRLAKDAEWQVKATGLLQADQLQALPMVKVKKLELQNIDYSATRLAIERLVVLGFDGLLKVSETGEVMGFPRNAQSKLDDKATTPMVSITELDLAGKVRWVDQSQSQVVSLVLPTLQLKVSDLGQGQVASFNLRAKHQEEHRTGELLIEGTGGLLDSPVNAALTVTLTQFELHQISPYLSNGIRSGRLALDASVQVTNGQVSADNRVRIERLKVDAEQAKAAVGTDLPIALALDLLKDKNDRIDLKVPIETRLGKLAVDTSDIVNTALANAAKKAAFAYVKQALQPLGTLMLMKDVAQAAARPRFQPILFDPGSAEMKGLQRDYADKVVGLMKDRPSLMITLCGVATQADVSAISVVEKSAEGAIAVEPQQQDLNAALQALAVSRGKEVTRWLVAGGIAVERLFACRPEVLNDDSLPRVLISL